MMVGWKHIAIIAIGEWQSFASRTFPTILALYLLETNEIENELR